MTYIQAYSGINKYDTFEDVEDAAKQCVNLVILLLTSFYKVRMKVVITDFDPCALGYWDDSGRTLCSFAVDLEVTYDDTPYRIGAISWRYFSEYRIYCKNCVLRRCASNPKDLLYEMRHHLCPGQ